MKKRRKPGDGRGGPRRGTLVIDAAGADEAMAGAEPWSPIETRLVVWSFVAAAVALVIFGAIINVTILAR